MSEHVRVQCLGLGNQGNIGLEPRGIPNRSLTWATVEITLNSVNINGDGDQNLRWTSSLVFDSNANCVKELYGKNCKGEESDDVANAVAYGFDSYYALQIGHPIGSAYDLKKLGIFNSLDEVKAYVNDKGEMIQPNATAGDIKFEDWNGDGVIENLKTVYENDSICLLQFTAAYKDKAGVTKRIDMRYIYLFDRAMSAAERRPVFNEGFRNILCLPDRIIKESRKEVKRNKEVVYNDFIGSTFPVRTPFDE